MRSRVLHPAAWAVVAFGARVPTPGSTLLRSELGAAQGALPAAFPIMEVDDRFDQRSADAGDRPTG